MGVLSEREYCQEEKQTRLPLVDQFYIWYRDPQELAYLKPMGTRALSSMLHASQHHARATGR